MKLSRSLRWFIGITLLLIVLTRIDADRVWMLVGAVQFQWLALAVAIFAVSHLVLVESLFWAARGLGVNFRRGTLVATHFESLFVGTFLPSSLGVEVVKAVDLGRRSGRPTLTVMAIGLQKAVAFTVVLVILAWLLPSTVKPKLSLTDVGSERWYLAALLLALLLLASAFLARRFWSTIRRNLNESVEAFLRLVRFGRGSAAFGVLLLQILAVSLNIVGTALASRSLGLAIEWQQFCYVVPATYVAAALPITVSGLGVREGVYATLLGLEGVDVTSAVTLSLLIFSISLFYSIVGGVISLLRPDSLLGRRGEDAQ